MKRVFSIFICLGLLLLLCSCETSLSQISTPERGEVILDVFGSTIVMNPSDIPLHGFETARLTIEHPIPLKILSTGGYDIQVNGKNVQKDETTEVVLTELSYGSGIQIKLTDPSSGIVYESIINSYPNAAPEFITKPKESNDGFYYFTVDQHLIKMNSLGKVVFYWNLAQPCLDFKRTEVNGEVFYSFLMAAPDEPALGDVGYIPCKAVVTDERYNVLDMIPYLLESESIRSKSPLDSHDFMVLGKGHYLINGYYGKHINNIPKSANPSDFGTRVVACVLQEIKDGEVLWQWDSTDYSEFYELSLLYNDYHNETLEWSDYMHFNSFSIDPSDNNLICSMRNLSAVVKIDRKTGEVLWILGGKGDQFGLTDAQKMNLQHFAQLTSDGTITIFDNGTAMDVNGKYDFTKGLSRVVEYKIDEATKKLLSFNDYTLDNHYSFIMGSAQKISSEPVVFLVGWGGRTTKNALFSEIDFTNKEIMFEVNYSKKQFSSDTYRVYKFAN